MLRRRTFTRSSSSWKITNGAALCSADSPSAPWRVPARPKTAGEARGLGAGGCHPKFIAELLPPAAAGATQLTASSHWGHEEVFGVERKSLQPWFMQEPQKHSCSRAGVAMLAGQPGPPAAPCCVATGHSLSCPAHVPRNLGGGSPDHRAAQDRSDSPSTSHRKNQGSSEQNHHEWFR